MFERLVSYRYRLLPPAFLIGLGFPAFVERTYKMDVILSAITALVLFTAWLALWPHKRVRWLGFVLMVAAITTMTCTILRMATRTRRPSLPRLFWL